MNVDHTDRLLATSEVAPQPVSSGFATYSWNSPHQLEPGTVSVMKSFGMFLEKQDDATQFRVRIATFDAIAAMHAVSSSMTMRWVRGTEEMRARYVIVFVNRGSVEVTSEDDSHLASSKEGSFCIIFPGRGDVTIQVEEESELLAFGFDEQEFVPLKLFPASIRHLPADSAVFRCAYIYLVGLVQSSGHVSSSSASVLKLLTREVARAIAFEASSDSREENFVEQSQQVIRRRFRDPDFNADVLAAELGISRRSLDRAYMHQPRSISEEIRHFRTHFAFTLLVEQEHLAARFVAADSGFKSAEVLRRSLIRQYGRSAAEIRLRREAETGDSSVKTAGPIAD
jgi:AraC-like DNA-binding protein